MIALIFTLLSVCTSSSICTSRVETYY